MKFTQRYELLDWLETDAEKTSFAAHDVSTGNAVLIHVLPDVNRQEAASLLETARLKEAEFRTNERPVVIEVSQYRGAVYIVTPVFPGPMTVREWLERDHAGDTSGDGLVPDAQVQPSESKKEPGEFTRLFGGYGTFPVEIGGDNGSRSEKAGEFTRAFEASKKQEADPVTPPAKIESAGPSDFSSTGIFQAGHGSLPVNTQSDPPPSPARSNTSNIPDAPVFRPESGSKTEEETSEFTRLFYQSRNPPGRTRRTEHMPKTSAPPPAGKAEEDHAIGWRRQTEWVPQLRWPDRNESEKTDYVFMPNRSEARQPPATEGPGEFTRIVERRSAPPSAGKQDTPAANPAPEADAAATGPAGPSYLIPVVLGVALVCIAALVVLYFLLKR